MPNPIRARPSDRPELRRRLAQWGAQRAPGARRKARRRPLQTEDRDELAAAPDHRRGQRIEVGFALADGLGHPGVARASSSRASDARSVIVRSVNADQLFGNARLIGRRAEREHHLAGGGGVGDARPPESRHADHARRRRDEVDGDRLAPARNRQRRGLAGLLHQPGQPRPRPLAHVELAEHAVRQCHELEPEAVGAVGGALDETAGLERAQQPGGRARVDPDPPRELVDPETGIARGHLVEQRQRARHRGHPLP